jgi:hypothetical protein
LLGVSVILGLFIVFVHFWSVTVVTRLSEAHKPPSTLATVIQAPGSSSGTPPSSAEPDPKEFIVCEYCGHDKAHFVCHKCDSLQWRKLHFLNTQSENWTWGVFVAHHRWKLLSVFLPVVVVGTVAFGAQVRVEAWKKEDARKDEAQKKDAVRKEREMAQGKEVIDAMIGFRSALPELLAMCGNSPSDPTCRTRFEAFTKDYFKFSWYVVPVAERYLQHDCNPDAGPLSPLRKRACDVFKRNSGTETSEEYYSFMREYLPGRETGDAGPTPWNPDRCVAAWRLYVTGRILSCAVAMWSIDENLSGSGPAEATEEDDCLDAFQKNPYDPKSWKLVPEAWAPGVSDGGKQFIWAKWGCPENLEERGDIRCWGRDPPVRSVDCPAKH